MFFRRDRIADGFFITVIFSGIISTKEVVNLIKVLYLYTLVFLADFAKHIAIKRPKRMDCFVLFVFV